MTRPHIIEMVDDKIIVDYPEEGEKLNWWITLDSIEDLEDLYYSISAYLQNASRIQ